MMVIKSKMGDVKGETMCIVCALVVLALLFAGSIALVVVIQTKDVNHSRFSGVPVNTIEEDNSDEGISVKSSDEEIGEGEHDDDLSERINEPWGESDWAGSEKSPDTDYSNGEMSPLKRILKYGRHGQYVADSYYNPNLARKHQKKISIKLLDLLSEMIGTKDEQDSKEEVVDSVLLRLIQKLKERKTIEDDPEDSAIIEMITPILDTSNLSDNSTEPEKYNVSLKLWCHCRGICLLVNHIQRLGCLAIHREQQIFCIDCRRSDRYEEILLDHVAHPQHDIPHETSYEVPHEIHESVKLTDDWLNLIEHEEGAMHIEDELRKNQMLHGDGGAVHPRVGHPRPHVHHGRERRSPHRPKANREKRRQSKDYELHASGEPVYNQIHHDEAHGHTGEEVRYKTAGQYDDEMVFSADFGKHKGRPVEVNHHQSVHEHRGEYIKRSGAVMDHYDEIQVEAKGIPSYYDTPEFLLPDAAHYIKGDQKKLELEEQHKKEKQLKNAKDRRGASQTQSTDEDGQKDPKHTEQDNHLEVHKTKKKSSLPEFTANMDTMLLELEEEEGRLKEEIAHLPETLDKNLHYKNRKDLFINYKNAYHHDTNRPNAELDEVAHNQIFKLMYAEDIGRLHDKLDHIQSEEAHLREDINAKHHVTAPIPLHSTTTDHQNRMKVTIKETKSTKKATSSGPQAGDEIGEPHVTNANSTASSNMTTPSVATPKQRQPAGVHIDNINVPQKEEDREHRHEEREIEERNAGNTESGNENHHYSYHHKSGETPLHTRKLHHKIVDTDFAPNPHEINHARHVKPHQYVQHLEDKRILHDMHEEHKEGLHTPHDDDAELTVMDNHNHGTVFYNKEKRTNLHLKEEGLDHPFLQEKHNKDTNNHIIDTHGGHGMEKEKEHHYDKEGSDEVYVRTAHMSEHVTGEHEPNHARRDSEIQDMRLQLPVQETHERDMHKTSDFYNTEPDYEKHEEVQSITDNQRRDDHGIHEFHPNFDHPAHESNPHESYHTSRELEHYLNHHGEHKRGQQHNVQESDPTPAVRTNEHDEIVDVRAWPKHPQNTEHYSADAGLSEDVNLDEDYQHKTDQNSIHLSKHHESRQHTDDIPLISNNINGTHKHMDNDDVHTQQYHTDTFKAPIDENAFINLWSQAYRKQLDIDNDFKDSPAAKQPYSNDHSFHHVHNDGEPELNSLETHHPSLKRRRHHVQPDHEKGENKAHRPEHYKDHGDHSIKRSDLWNGEWADDSNHDGDADDEDVFVPAEDIDHDHDYHDVENDENENQDQNEKDYFEDYDHAGDHLPDEVWLKRLLHNKRNHHNDESVDHHEEEDAGIPRKGSTQESISKDDISKSSTDSSENLMMSLRKLLHKESHDDDPHELKREDDWHRYRSIREHNRDSHGGKTPTKKTYIDNEIAVNHMPHGNPALDGTHAKLDIHEKRVLLAGPDHYPIEHIENSPHRNDHGIPEKKSQPLYPHNTDFEHPNDVKQVDPHLNLHSDYVKEYASHHPGQGDVNHMKKWFNGDHSYDRDSHMVDTDGDHDHQEKRVHGDYKYLTDGETWHPENYHGSRHGVDHKRTHHGEPDWNHEHDWIDHGAKAELPDVSQPDVEDDNVFEALQDDPDNVRHYDDQLNQIEYDHSSNYHHRSYHDMNHKELFKGETNKTMPQRRHEMGNHELVGSDDVTDVQRPDTDERKRNHKPDMDGLHVEAHADDHDIRYQEHHRRETTTQSEARFHLDEGARFVVKKDRIHNEHIFGIGGLIEHQGSHVVEMRDHHYEKDPHNTKHNKRDYANHEDGHNQETAHQTIESDMHELLREHNPHREHGDHSNSENHVVTRGHTGHHSHWEHGDDKRQQPDEHLEIQRAEKKSAHDDHGVNIHNDWIKKRRHGYFNYDDRTLHEKAVGHVGDTEVHIDNDFSDLLEEGDHTVDSREEYDDDVKRDHHESETEHTLQHEGGIIPDDHVGEIIQEAESEKRGHVAEYDHEAHPVEVSVRHGHDYAKKDHYEPWEDDHNIEGERRDHHDEPEHEHDKVRIPDRRHHADHRSWDDQKDQHHGEINHEHVAADHTKQKKYHHVNAEDPGIHNHKEMLGQDRHKKEHDGEETIDHGMRRHHDDDHKQENQGEDHHNEDLIEKQYHDEIWEGYEEQHLPDAVHNIKQDEHSTGDNRHLAHEREHDDDIKRKYHHTSSEENGNHPHTVDYNGARQHHGFDEKREHHEVADDGDFNMRRNHHDDEYDVENSAQDHHENSHDDTNRGYQGSKHEGHGETRDRHEDLDEDRRNHHDNSGRHDYEGEDKRDYPEHDKRRHHENDDDKRHHDSSLEDHAVNDDWHNHHGTDKRVHHTRDGDDSDHHEDREDEEREQHDDYGHHDTEDVRREHHNPDNAEDDDYVDHRRGHHENMEERAHPEDDKAAVNGDVHSEDHHPKHHDEISPHIPEHDSDESEPWRDIGETAGFNHQHHGERSLQHPLIEQHERLHDSKAHLPDLKLTHDLDGDGHIHSGDIEFPVGEQNDRGINGHRTENLFTKELLGESDEYHAERREHKDDRVNEHVGHHQADDEYPEFNHGLHSADPYPHAAGFEVDPGFEKGEAIDNHEIEYHSPHSVLHIPGDALEHHDQHNLDPLDVAISRGDLAEDVDPELFYPQRAVEGHGDADSEHGDVDDVMDHELTNDHQEDEHGPPPISDLNLDVLSDDTPHGHDRHNGEDEHHENSDNHVNDINDFHSSHHDHNSDQDHDTFLHDEELSPHHVDGNEPHEPEHNGNIVVVQDDGDHIQSHDTDNDLSDLEPPAHMPNSQNIKHEELVNEDDDAARAGGHPDDSHGPYSEHSSDHTLDKALHNGQHHGRYHGALHDFDPELYAKLGYWPYDHIDGDARQLYYAQWLKRHPIKHAESADGQRLAGDDIKLILSQKLHHFNKRSADDRQRYHYPSKSEMEKMKMYAEFLKRNYGEDNYQHQINEESGDSVRDGSESYHDEKLYSNGVDIHDDGHKRLVENDHSHTLLDNENFDNEPAKRKQKHDGYTMGEKTKNKDSSYHSINYVNPNHLLEARNDEVELDNHHGVIDDDWSDEIINSDQDIHRYIKKRLQNLDHEKKVKHHKRNWQYNDWGGNEHVLDHNAHREMSDEDENHFVDVLDSERHHVDTEEGESREDGHSDSEHHSLADEHSDVRHDGRPHFGVGAEDVETLFGTEPGKHHQFDPEIYGDIAQFDSYDTDKRHFVSFGEGDGDVYDDDNDIDNENHAEVKRLGDTIWDAEIPDDDDPNLHVHTHFMNNYNPAEHPDTFKPVVHPNSRTVNDDVQPAPFLDTHDGMYPHGYEHETQELAENKIIHYDTRQSQPEHNENDLHNEVKLEAADEPDRHEPIDFSSLSRDTADWGKRGHIHNDHEGLGNVLHWDNKRQHIPHDATHDGMEHMDVDSQHFMNERDELDDHHNPSNHDEGGIIEMDQDSWSDYKTEIDGVEVEPIITKFPHPADQRSVGSYHRHVEHDQKEALSDMIERSHHLRNDANPKNPHGRGLHLPHNPNHLNPHARTQHLPHDPHHDNPHAYDEIPSDDLDVVYHPDTRHEEDSHHDFEDYHHNAAQGSHQGHIKDSTMAHFKHMMSSTRIHNNKDEKNKGGDNTEDMAMKLVMLLQEYNNDKSTSTTHKPKVEVVKYNHSNDQLDRWLEEILQINTDDSEILSAALELYADKTKVIGATEEVTQKETKPFRLSHHFLKAHRNKKWKATGRPTFHVKGRKAGMTFKRILSANVNSTETSNGNDVHYNQSEIPFTPDEFNINYPYNGAEAVEITEAKSDEQIAAEIEMKIIDYVIHNMSLTESDLEDASASTISNKTLVDRLAVTSVSANWLIIGVCLTFSVTCLCALMVGVITLISKRQRFSTDVWWNSKRDTSDEEQMWLGSRSDDDLEFGRGSKLTHLYSLQGEELKTQVSQMVNNIGSTSTSSASVK